jgi:hypothetical protein
LSLVWGCRASTTSRQCEFSAECQGNLICFAGYCRAQCQTNRDCPVGTTCAVTQDPAQNACQLGCTTAAECDPSNTCFHGLCTVACTATTNCARFGAGSVCDPAEHVCVIVPVVQPDAGSDASMNDAGAPDVPDVMESPDVVEEPAPTDKDVEQDEVGLQDVGMDVGPQDAGMDAGPQDAGIDARVDAASDAGPADVPTDVPTTLPIVFTPAGNTAQRGSQATGGPRTCPSGQAVVGVFASPFAGFWEGNLTALQVYCGVVTTPNMPGATTVSVMTGNTLPTSTTYFTGNNAPAATGTAIRCPANQVMVGFGGAARVSSGPVSQIILRCATITRSGATLSVGTVTNGASVGAVLSGQNFPTTSFAATDCPANTVAIGESGFIGNILDSFGLQCGSMAVGP